MKGYQGTKADRCLPMPLGIVTSWSHRSLDLLVFARLRLAPLKSARTSWFHTSPRNPSGIPTKTCWLFTFLNDQSPFLSNLVLLISSNLVP